MKLSKVDEPKMKFKGCIYLPA